MGAEHKAPGALAPGLDLPHLEFAGIGAAGDAHPVLVISQAITHGRRAVWPLVVGVTLGDFTAMTLSLLGLGAVMAASAALFSVLKWIGAVYLVYLGVKLWRSNPEKHELRFSRSGNSTQSLSKSAFIVTALNPKSIAFLTIIKTFRVTYLGMLYACL